MRRFDFSNLFEIEGTESIAAYTLDDVPELRGVDVDAMKLDTQGLELPILNAAKTAVESAICIETETGFCQNYKGETTFDQSRFMSAKGFGLFSINVNHCVPRLNQLARESHQEQVLWCEAIWMRDFLSVQGDAKAGLSREKAIKALCLYANHGCFSFGLVTADFFRQNGLIDNEEFEALARGVAFWQLSTKQGVTVMGKVLRSALHLLPRRFYASIEHALSDLYHVPHPFRRFFGK